MTALATMMMMMMTALTTTFAVVMATIVVARRRGVGFAGACVAAVARAVVAGFEFVGARRRRRRRGDASTTTRAKTSTASRAARVVGVIVHDAGGARLDDAAERIARGVVARGATRGATRRVVVYDREGEFARARGTRALDRALERSMTRDAAGAREKAWTYALRACDAQRGGVIRHVGGVEHEEEDDDDDDDDDDDRVDDDGGVGRDSMTRRRRRRRRRRHVVVDVLGGGDACAAIVDAARNADVDIDVDDADDADDVNFTYKPKVERLERWMRERGSFIPPPDVIIIFGETFHLDGFPPWQLHAAELYHECSIETFTERHFDRVIERFARTSQRFGR